jgi:nucleotide-binding universal stress UspA family protein
MKNILASLSGFGSDQAVLDTAIALAKWHDGHVLCLHTRIDAVRTAAVSELASTRHGLSQGLVRRIAAEEDARSRHAAEAFQGALRRHGLAQADTPPLQGSAASLAWVERLSFLNETLHQARYHDLVVMGRDHERPAEHIKSIVMLSGRPVLLAPPRPAMTIGRHVAIAWKPGVESARAAAATTALLTKAERVTILAVAEQDGDVARLAAEDLAASLGWHGIRAEVRVQPASGHSGQMLQEMAYESGADLLVMGAYGHSRLREYIFGGVTEAMIAACSLPVLLFH